MKKIISYGLQPIKKTEFIIEEQDIGTFKKCLDYCAHRLREHKCGIAGIVDEKKLEQIREYLQKSKDCKESEDCKNINEPVENIGIKSKQTFEKFLNQLLEIYQNIKNGES